MTFYSKMAWNYEEIFPVTQSKLDFVKSRLETRQEARVLDIGCATGQFPYLLAKAVPSVQYMDAFDLDREMIELAKERYPLEHVNYRQGNMLELDTMYMSTYDMITCFGNTLVHIGNENVHGVLSNVYKHLTAGGMFVLQLLNYDYVMEQKIEQLPLIETDTLMFRRHYEEITPQRLTFVTALSIKDHDESYEGRIPLYPLYKRDILQWLQEIGFTDIMCYKNYMEAAYDGTGLPLIITAVK